MEKQNNEPQKVISIEELCKRYSMFSKKDGEPLSKRSINKWRNTRGFPDPIITTPRLHFSLEDVLKWEKANGFEKYV